MELDGMGAEWWAKKILRLINSEAIWNSWGSERWHRSWWIMCHQLQYYCCYSWQCLGCLGMPWGALVLFCMISATGIICMTPKRPCCWEQHCRGWMGFASPSFFYFFQASWQNTAKQIPAFANWISRGRGPFFNRGRGKGAESSPPFPVSRQRRPRGGGTAVPELPPEARRHPAPKASQSLPKPLFWVFSTSSPSLSLPNEALGEQTLSDHKHKCPPPLFLLSL